MTRISALRVNLIWWVNPVESDYFSFSSLFLFFRFHLLILSAIHDEKADAFIFIVFCFFFYFYAFHCGLHSAVHGEKADAFFF
jgi:hypothetical protein